MSTRAFLFGLRGTVQRYRFNEYILSPRRRLLLRNGVEVPLIPRYFDLLVFLVEHRHEAVHRRDIFERVWSDAIVSDSALSQAIRTIRRALDDDPREPRFVRTVSRHGYRFMHDEVIEEEDLDVAGRPAGEAPAAVAVTPPAPAWSWSAAAVGGAAAGGMAGATGGGLLMALPGSAASTGIVPVLAVVGLVSGGIAGAGVGAGLRWASTVAWIRQPLALVIGGALGGLAVGTFVQWMTRWSLATLVGLHLPIGGSVEGLVLGGAVGLGYGWIAGRRGDDPEATSDRRWWTTILVTALTCGVAALALALAGRPLVGGTLHALADLAQGAQTSLAPFGQLLGEPGFGALTSALIAFGEGAVFGAGVAWGLQAPFWTRWGRG